MGFLLMYDITNEESFNSVQDWWVVFSFLILFARLDNTLLLCRCTQIKTYSWDNAQVILVGNKCDMEDERVISYERGKQLADQLGLEFFETSAKENINVKVSCQMDAETSKFVDWPDWPSSRPSLNVWWTSSATKCPRAWIAIPTWSTRPKGRGWRTKRPLPTPAPANAEHHQVIHYKISTFSPDAPSKENRIKKTPTAAAAAKHDIVKSRTTWYFPLGQRHQQPIPFQCPRGDLLIQNVFKFHPRIADYFGFFFFLLSTIKRNIIVQIF